MIAKLKICKLCGFIGLEIKFKIDGHKRPSNICKTCDSRKSAAYRLLHLETYKASQKDWRLKNKEKKAAAAKEWRKNSPKAKVLIKKHKYSRYNITENEFKDMLKSQDNKCRICKTDFLYTSKFNTPQIDHDHTCCPTSCKCCGKCIRGLLCQDCNRFLGRIKDNPEISDRMSDYLRDNEYTRRNSKQSGNSTTTITGLEFYS